MIFPSPTSMLNSYTLCLRLAFPRGNVAEKMQRLLPGKVPGISRALIAYLVVVCLTGLCLFSYVLFLLHDYFSGYGIDPERLCSVSFAAHGHIGQDGRLVQLAVYISDQIGKLERKVFQIFLNRFLDRDD